MNPKSQVAYVAWEIGAVARGRGESQKGHVACVAWEIGAFGQNPKSHVACVAWEIGVVGEGRGESEKLGSICSMGNRGFWGGPGGEVEISWGGAKGRLGGCMFDLYSIV